MRVPALIWWACGACREYPVREPGGICDECVAEAEALSDEWDEVERRLASHADASVEVVLDGELADYLAGVDVFSQFDRMSEHDAREDVH